MGVRYRPRAGGQKNARQYRHHCEWCGRIFESARPDALTCSNAHRLSWNRWRRKIADMGRGEAVVGPRGDHRKQHFIGYPPERA